MPVEALLLPLRMPLFCSFEIIALVGCGILAAALLFYDSFSQREKSSGVIVPLSQSSFFFLASSLQA